MAPDTTRAERSPRVGGAQYAAGVETFASDLRRSLAALRVRQWAPFALLPLGAVAPGELPAGVAAAALGSAAGSLAFAYGLNARADAPSDAPGAKNPLAGGEPPRTLAPVLALAVLGAAALTAPLGPQGQAALGVSLLGGWLYSGPARLKARPGFGLLGNHAIFLPLLYLGPGATPGRPALTLALLVLLTQNQLLHELADRAEDRRAGDRTTALWLGPDRVDAVVRGTGLLGAALLGGLAAFGGWGPLPLALGLLAATVVGTLPRDPATLRRVHGRVALGAGALGYLGALVG